MSRNVDLEAANAKLEHRGRANGAGTRSRGEDPEDISPAAEPDDGRLAFAWAFDPCQELAGDSLNIVQLDADHVAFYVLDVSGHGVASSLLAVAATRLLSSVGHGDSIVMRTQDGVTAPVGPAEVAAMLNDRFTWNQETGQFMTLFYAVFNAKTRELTYVSAGHPGAIRIARGKEPETLDGTGLPIGIGEDYEQHTVRLGSGDRLYLYSDGVTEAMNPMQQMYGINRLTWSLQRGLHNGLAESVAALQGELLAWHGGGIAKDDISVLGVECG